MGCFKDFSISIFTLAKNSKELKLFLVEKGMGFFTLSLPSTASAPLQVFEHFQINLLEQGNNGCCSGSLFSSQSLYHLFFSISGDSSHYSYIWQSLFINLLVVTRHNVIAITV